MHNFNAFYSIHDELYSNIQTIDILAFERFETINFFRWLLKLVIAGWSTEIIDYKLIIVMLKGFENLINIFVESLDLPFVNKTTFNETMTDGMLVS